MKLVIFDLDGTLLDTIDDLGAAANHVLERHGLPLHGMDEYRLMVGRGMRNLIRMALPDGTSEDTVSVMLSEFLEWYQEHLDIATRPYPGVQELVSRLNRAGFRLAVASNKIQPGTERLVSKFFPGIPFVAVMGNCSAFPLKPDPALVRYIMDRAGVCESDTLMVGDSGIDIETAHNAGIPVIAVSWGFRPRIELAAADSIADTVDELGRTLLEA